jgi:uncharacterized protein (TIGR02145 family)
MKCKILKQVFIVTLLCVAVISCKKESVDSNPELPTVLTLAISEVTETSALSGGEVTDEGGATVTTKGICWSTNSSPTITDSKTTDGSGEGSFVSEMINLLSNTKYYVRAYATNSVGTAYGNERSFTTGIEVIVTTPTISTNEVSEVTSTSAVCGGNVTDDGNAIVTARGVCWSTTNNPTIEDNKTVDGANLGSFISNLTGLASNTTYYIRAYATNSEGTTYGSERSFITSDEIIITIPTVTTYEVTTITSTTAVSGGDVVEDGGAQVTERGVCWSNSTSPTIADSKLIDGFPYSFRNFLSVITGLTPNTTYYIRAYAINSAGTAYGNEVSFTTEEAVACATTVTDIDGNVYCTVQIGTQLWMAENLTTTRYNDGTSIPNNLSEEDWGNTTSGAYRIYNSNPTYDLLYGKSYNWHAINTGKLCPIGWHVPTNDEWATLMNFLGGQAVAGGKMKSTGNNTDGTGLWDKPNKDATNTSGFNALPGGVNAKIEGSGGIVGSGAYFWTSSFAFSNNARRRYITYTSGYLSTSFADLNQGNSCRCVKD